MPIDPKKSSALPSIDPETRVISTSHQKHTEQNFIEQTLMGRITKEHPPKGFGGASWVMNPDSLRVTETDKISIITFDMESNRGLLGVPDFRNASQVTAIVTQDGKIRELKVKHPDPE